MPYLIAAVVLVGALGLLNLALTAAVVRRLRRLADLPAGATGSPVPELLTPGTTVDAFSATALDGRPVSLDGLATPAVIAFLAPGCRPCEDLLPELVARADRHATGRAGVVAVLSTAAPAEAADYRRRLGDSARLVVEDADGELHRAFRVAAFPTLYRIDAAGRVLAAGSSFAGLDRTDTSVRV